MEHTPEEIGRMMDALDLWKVLTPFNWAIRPRGTVFPYFCTLLLDSRPAVRARLLMLEGWQTFHDYIRTRLDRFFGFYLTPMEMPHFELVVAASGETKVFRHDPGYMPRELTDGERELVAKVMWEAYGVMLRIEGDRKLPMTYADEQAMFSRLEGADGVWTDSPLAIPRPADTVERISFPKADIDKAKDLPFANGEAIEVDFRMLTNVMTQEKRPRSVYALVVVDGATGERLVCDKASVGPDGGLKALWEAMPARLLKHIIARGRFPGEIRLVSGRVFRMLRPLTVQIPFRLSLHDRLPHLEEANEV